MTLFVIDWTLMDTTPLLELCRESSHEVVGYEFADGGRAYKKTGELKPDAIIINYNIKPSHGKETAGSIKNRKSTAQIPIYFIDGEVEDNEHCNHLGICLSSEELKELLES
ncbi:response regulator [Flavobacterium rhizosphaerae]|uniref:Response regulatory domain-containing protein n=1 Tax=Flavobacterium rhizosphaerae TaxID=3163298 RepID=A0ABW8YTR2_9FLAO